MKPAALPAGTIAEPCHAAELKSDFKPPRSGPDKRAANVDLEQRSEASVGFDPVTSFRGVDKMTVRIFAMVPATILALGAATALAQPSANPLAQFGRTNLIDHSTSLWPYDETGVIVANAAFVSDGCTPSYLQNQQEVLRGPGYSIGTGAAELCDGPATVGDGSDPTYLRNQQEVRREPGYSIGTGAAGVSGAW